MLNGLLCILTSQRQGIGTALMEQIESYFEQAQRFELFTGQKSDRNIQFYERLGYKVFKSEEINKNLSFVFMEKHRSSSQKISTTKCCAGNA